MILPILIIECDIYTTPACLRLEYVTAIPIPSIPKAKNPGTNLSTVAPHEELFDRALLAAAAVLTSVDTGPTNEVPIRIATNPPIRFAIILSCLFNPP